MRRNNKKNNKNKIVQDGNLQPGEETEINITDINHQGQGIGHVNGLTVFVDQTVPGDCVKAVIQERKPKYAIGYMKELITSSSFRIEPDCPLASACGGCTLQMMDYAAQLIFKQNQIKNALKRIGGISLIEDEVQPVIGMENPWHYRSKVQFPVSGDWNQPKIGFFASRSHMVVDGDECLIQPSVCDAIRKTVRAHIRRWRLDPYREEDHQGLIRHLVIRAGFATGDLMVILVINGDGLPGQDELIQNLQTTIAENQSAGLPEQRLRSFYLNVHRTPTNVILSEDCRLQFGDPYIEENILGLTYRISPLAFFQVNPTQTEVLYKKIIELADLSGQDQVLDLYCGTGSITLQLARAAGWVLGIESHPEAIRDAKINAEINNITNVEFITGKVEDSLPEWLTQGLKIDLVVLDPPRKGCEPKVIEALQTLLPPRIIYVSCNPATLARDLSLLSSSGYKVQYIQPVDMFPWTGHVETVVLMSRVKE